MIKNCYALIFTSLLSLWGIAQGSNNPIDPLFGNGDHIVAYQFGFGQTTSHEIRVDHFINERVSLIYGMRYSQPTIRENASDAEFTAPLGASIGVGIGVLFGSTTACGYGDGDLLLSAFMYSCMIPDGLAFHFYPHKKIDVSPYFNVTGLTIANRNDRTEFYYTPSAGLRMLYNPTDHLVVSAEQQILVRPEQTYVANTLIGIGIKF
jgi:hypothetical protein